MKRRRRTRRTTDVGEESGARGGEGQHRREGSC
jgi:hypothetical protein